MPSSTSYSQTKLEHEDGELSEDENTSSIPPPKLVRPPKPQRAAWTNPLDNPGPSKPRTYHPPPSSSPKRQHSNHSQSQPQHIPSLLNRISSSSHNQYSPDISDISSTGNGRTPYGLPTKPSSGFTSTGVQIISPKDKEKERAKEEEKGKESNDRHAPERSYRNGDNERKHSDHRSNREKVKYDDYDNTPSQSLRSPEHHSKRRSPQHSYHRYDDRRDREDHYRPDLGRQDRYRPDEGRDDRYRPDDSREDRRRSDEYREARYPRNGSRRDLRLHDRDEPEYSSQWSHYNSNRDEILKEREYRGSHHTHESTRSPIRNKVSPPSSRKTDPDRDYHRGEVYDKWKNEESKKSVPETVSPVNDKGKDKGQDANGTNNDNLKEIKLVQSLKPPSAPPPPNQASNDDIQEDVEHIPTPPSGAPPPPPPTEEVAAPSGPPPPPPPDTPPSPPERTSTDNTPLAPSQPLPAPSSPQKSQPPIKSEQTVNPYAPKPIPHAPNRNLLEPPTRAGTPTAKKEVNPYESSTQRFRSLTAEEELQKLEKIFEGTTTLAAYDLGAKLGEGTFGVVTKGVEIATKRVIALKKLITHNPRDGVSVTTVREIKILKSLSHPNVVPILNMVVERKIAGDRSSRGEVFMVFPYMDHDLCGLLANKDFKMSHSTAKLLMKQILEGMAFIHANNFIHRDIKTANILVDKHGQIMIADFGLARAWTHDAAMPPHLANEYTNMVVTRWYRAPELLLGDTRYGPAVDMWSLGCVLGEMYFRHPILSGDSDRDQLYQIFSKCGPLNQDTFPNWDRLPGFPDSVGHPWDKTPGDYPILESAPKWGMDRGGTDLMIKLLTLDPKKRLTAHIALDHAWFWISPLPADPKKTTINVESSHEMTTRQKQEPVVAPVQAPVRPPVNTRPSPQQNFNNLQNRPPPYNNGGPRGPPPFQQQQPGFNNYPQAGYPQQPPPQMGYQQQQPQPIMQNGNPYAGGPPMGMGMGMGMPMPMPMPMPMQGGFNAGPGGFNSNVNNNGHPSYSRPPNNQLYSRPPPFQNQPQQMGGRSNSNIPNAPFKLTSSGGGGAPAAPFKLSGSGGGNLPRPPMNMPRPPPNNMGIKRGPPVMNGGSGGGDNWRDEKRRKQDEGLPY